MGKYYKWLIRIISLVVVVAAWQIFGSVIPVVVSTPTEVVSGFFYLLSANVPSGIEELSFLP